MLSGAQFSTQATCSRVNRAGGWRNSDKKKRWSSLIISGLSGFNRPQRPISAFSMVGTGVSGKTEQTFCTFSRHLGGAVFGSKSPAAATTPVGQNDCLCKTACLDFWTGMEDLIELVGRFRNARTLEEQLDAAGKLAVAVSPRLRAFILRACRDSVADDLLQDTLVKIAGNVQRFRGTTEAGFRAWCYTIARNTLRDHFRRKHVAEHLEPFDSQALRNAIDASSKNEAIARAEEQDLEYALSLLERAEPPCRGYLWSHYIRGLGFKEIARAYGLTYDAARMKVTRCLKMAIRLVAQHP
jgi:RNA polymerase sigma factor (sigma-70 family)